MKTTTHKVTDNRVEVLEALIVDVKAINKAWLKLLRSIPNKADPTDV